MNHHTPNLEILGRINLDISHKSYYFKILRKVKELMNIFQIIWGKICKYRRNAVSLAMPMILTLEKTQKIFGFLLAYSYLCRIIDN